MEYTHFVSVVGLVCNDKNEILLLESPRICKNVQKDVVNIDFSCKYLGGELTTSDESLHVKWLKKMKL